MTKPLNNGSLNGADQRHGPDRRVPGRHYLLPAENSGREEYLRAKAAIRGLKRRYGLDHITAEIEFGDENCPMSD